MAGIAPDGNVDDRIWITSRIRMISERKALRKQNYSYLLLTYYSLFVVIISVFSQYYKSYYGLFDSINISASVLVLAASLVVSGFRFEATASIFRDCYLGLQKLHGDDLSFEEKQKRYMDILSKYPNHSDNDYYDMLINHTLLEGKKLKNGETELSYTKFMAFSYLYRSLFFYLIVIVLFVLPVAFLCAPLLGLGVDVAK
ncbi:MAG: SLATT domain-containing protein [Mesorhizobium sp.]|uniref:SLATT domain-containing protein n=1 Tax=Mesorhizobium sp. TaxID=1871066 RepID=UPI00121DE05C|nr:SLATT domain-containing protein [Mesorhizobium sp.]TIL56285.1 MAG: SLATT domain-containing protein [Mesorhizobium sp.]